MLVTDDSRKQVFVLVLPSLKLSFDYFCLAPRTPKNFIHQYVLLTHSSSSVYVRVVYQCDKSPRGSQEVHCGGISLAIVRIQSYPGGQKKNMITLLHLGQSVHECIGLANQ